MLAGALSLSGDLSEAGVRVDFSFADMARSFYRRVNWEMVAAVAIGGSWVTSMLPHTLGLGRYQKTLANYLEDGTEQPMDPKIDELTQKVLYSVNLDIRHELTLKTFMCYGTEPVSRGSLTTRFGAIVGIPHIFAYTEPADVQKQVFKIYSEYSYHDVSWDTEPGKQFLDSMLLSDKAKMFGITREVKLAQSYGPYVEASLRMIGCYVAYFGCKLLNNTVLSAIPSAPVKSLAFVGACAVAYVLYISLEDYYVCWKDTRVDLASCRLSQELAEGGVEFYEKMLQRNKAARVLLGRRGEEQYTVYGNEQTTLRRPHQALSHRLQVAQKCRDDLIENPPAQVQRFDTKNDEDEGEGQTFGKVFGV